MSSHGLFTFVQFLGPPLCCLNIISVTNQCTQQKSFSICQLFKLQAECLHFSVQRRLTVELFWTVYLMCLKNTKPPEVAEYDINFGRAIDQAVSRLLFIVETRVHTQVTVCVIGGRRSGTGTAFLSKSCSFPLPVAFQTCSTFTRISFEA
jgi:hypothetical protein